ncbi:MAG: DNA methylase [Clostridia bacterium]|nr:DNA methylase [Clostridia bacterium]
MQDKTYIAIDLKSFYASVECVDRGLNPLDANLVVADLSRTEKTICLAVSPSLKSFCIPGRARLFEVIEKVKEVNALRLVNAHGRKFSGKSVYLSELNSDPALELDYIVAVPQMKKYMMVSSEIYNIYLKYVAPEDIHVYSVDEVFIDATEYLKLYNLSARDFTMMMIKDVLAETGITATAGIGSNLYLCKIAMDIEAKHMPPDENGVRIAELDEKTYRKSLWSHRPLRDFWRVGRGYSEKLESAGLYTMGDIAACSLENEELLYKLFGINAELLIDHAWGVEPVTIADIKSYKTENNSICSGQVLQKPYTNDKARIIVAEMADMLSLDLVSKKVVCDSIVMDIGYDISNMSGYKGEVKKDYYGRLAPKKAHGTENFGKMTSSTKSFVDTSLRLYDRITDKSLLIRRISITANHVIPESEAGKNRNFEQINFFTNFTTDTEANISDNNDDETKEKQIQNVMLDIKQKFGKNSILKGMNYQEDATAKDRNRQVGGHKA